MDRSTKIFVGVLSMMWAVLFCILMLKCGMFLANSCNFTNLTAAILVISGILAVFVRAAVKKEGKKEKDVHKSDNSKKDGV